LFATVEAVSPCLASSHRPDPAASAVETSGAREKWNTVAEGAAPTWASPTLDTPGQTAGPKFIRSIWSICNLNLPGDRQNVTFPPWVP